MKPPDWMKQVPPYKGRLSDDGRSVEFTFELSTSALERALHEHAVYHRDVLPCNEKCADDIAARLFGDTDAVKRDVNRVQ